MCVLLLQRLELLLLCVGQGDAIHRATHKPALVMSAGPAGGCSGNGTGRGVDLVSLLGKGGDRNGQPHAQRGCKKRT